MKKTLLLILSLSLAHSAKESAKTVLSPLPGKVNRPFYHETAPSVVADGKTMFYLVQNPNKEGAKEKEDWEIFQSTLENGEWTGGVPVRALNSEWYEGYPSISADGRTIFFSSNAYSTLEDRDKDLFVSRFENGKWSKPENMGRNINFEGLDEIGGSISPNGQIFVFFADNRDDSAGKSDIYITYRGDDGSWQPAKNIGKSINSKYREIAPTLAADGRTLYFSSDRPGGSGGLDLYKSVLTGRSWSKPKNLGKKVNSKGHDIGITIPAEGNIFYTSQITGEGGFDIYTGELPPEARPFKVILVKGKVLDKTKKSPLAADILIEDLESGKSVGNYRANKDDGSFLVSLMEGTRYSFTAQSDGYFIASEEYNFKKIGSYREENLVLSMVPVVQGEKAVIKNIFFAKGSANLDKSSRLALERVVKLLQSNPQVKLEVQGHTDNKGGTEKNQKLSEQRAANVVKFLTSRGIAADRLKPKGLGETQPIAGNDTEDGRSKNRRIEFLVISK